MNTTNTQDLVLKALDRAFVMGQNYWADADSESWTANKRSDVTLEKFREMRDEVCAALQSPAPQPPGDVVVTWDYDRTRILAVTRQNDDHQIVEVIAEAPAAQASEPNWRHPKIQALIGADARNRITIDLIWKILEDPDGERTASDMEYWDAIHDAVKAAVAAPARAVEPLTDEQIDAVMDAPAGALAYLTDGRGRLRLFARAIERAHGITTPAAKAGKDGTHE